MFDGGTIEGGNGDVTEQDWKLLHHRLRGIAQQRIALEAQEIGYLVEAEEAQLHRRLGYATLLESQDPTHFRDDAGFGIPARDPTGR